jgi:selenocysteine lyase/cysteine desulfurase
MEQQPLRYFDRDLLPHLVYSARLLATFCKADRAGLALTQNATTALNGVIQGHVRICRERGVTPTIVVWDISYGSVKKMANHQFGANVVEIPFQANFLHKLRESPTEEVFLKALEQTIDSADKSWENSLLIIDQTTSNTALNLPVRALAQRAKQAGMLVLVDGAHGLLAQDIALDSDDYENVDMYVSNGHKWLYCPRGVAMLCCAKEELRETTLRQPAVVSHGIDDGYLSRFLWDGTRNYAAQLSLPLVLDHWNRRNPALVRTTMRTRLMDAIQILADLWHDGCVLSQSGTAGTWLFDLASGLLDGRSCRFIHLFDTSSVVSFTDSSTSVVSSTVSSTSMLAASSMALSTSSVNPSSSFDSFAF